LTVGDSLEATAWVGPTLCSVGIGLGNAPAGKQFSIPLPTSALNGQPVIVNDRLAAVAGQVATVPPEDTKSRKALWPLEIRLLGATLNGISLELTVRRQIRSAIGELETASSDRRIVALDRGEGHMFGFADLADVREVEPTSMPCNVTNVAFQVSAPALEAAK
jgi:hypothetical protein